MTRFWRYKIRRLWRDSDVYVLYRAPGEKLWSYVACVESRKEARQVMRMHDKIRKGQE